MTDDIIHSTQYYIKFLNRAVLANLQHRPLKLGRLTVPHETHTCYKKFCFHGNSLFPVPTQLIFQLEKHYTKSQTWANIFIYLLDHTFVATFANMKMECQRWPAMLLILGRSRTQYVAKITKLLCLNCWALLIILTQRIKHFWYKLAEISFFTMFDQNLVEYMYTWSYENWVSKP